MLHNRLSQLFQKETDRLLKDFLNDNPDLLQKYVDGGVAAVGAVLGPINAFMRHLLAVKGLDPDSIPGAAQKAMIAEAVSALFDTVHESSFDADYDFSWVHKRFEDTRKTLKDLTKDKFMALTDLSRTSSEPEDLSDEKFDDLVQRVQSDTVEAEKKELPIDDKVARLKEIAAKIKSEQTAPNYDAIQELRDFVRSYDTSQEEKGAPLKPGKKKLNKGKTPRGSGPRVQKISALPKKEKSIKEELREKRVANQAERVTALIHQMLEKGLIDQTVKGVEEQTKQMMSWNEESLAAMERVIQKHFRDTSKDENKFKGSFRRVKK